MVAVGDPERLLPHPRNRREVWLTEVRQRWMQSEQPTVRHPGLSRTSDESTCPYSVGVRRNRTIVPVSCETWDMALVWAGSNGATIVIATRESVEHQDAVVTALKDAKTWGDFRELLPDGEIEDRGFEEMFEEHEDDEPFDSELVWGVSDGDYPSNLSYDMTELLPEDLAEEFMHETRLHGDYPEVPVEELPRVRAALEAQGHTLTESPITFF